MYTYVTCCHDIGYTITTTSKILTKPSQAHYEMLKGIVKYLHETKHWGIKYKHYVGGDNLDPTTLVSDVVFNENLSPFPIDINQPKRMAFDAAYENDQRKW